MYTLYKKLPSKLFSNCNIPESGDMGVFDLIPEGFSHEVNLYLSKETLADDKAIEKAAQFFDKAVYWDSECRKIFLSFVKESEEYETVEEYFNFYKDEVPDVFEVEDVSTLSLADMVNCLIFKSMASHENGDEQHFVVDFTLGYDQILCVRFDCEYNYMYISWDS